MKAALFDLDNTLYDARQYFLGAFKDVSNYISAKYNKPERDVYETLQILWQEKTSLYPQLFDDMLNAMEISLDNPEEINEIVSVFNAYEGRLEPYPDVRPTLRQLRERGCKLGIVTDGTVARQKRKIAALGLGELFSTVVFTKEMGSKSSPGPFLKALAELALPATDACYVGDNPHIDFKGARAAGLKTVRILRGEFSKVPRNEHIDLEIEKMGELLEIVAAKV